MSFHEMKALIRAVGVSAETLLQVGDQEVSQLPRADDDFMSGEFLKEGLSFVIDNNHADPLDAQIFCARTVSLSKVELHYPLEVLREKNEFKRLARLIRDGRPLPPLMLKEHVNKSRMVTKQQELVAVMRLDGQEFAERAWVNPATGEYGGGLTVGSLKEQYNELKQKSRHAGKRLTETVATLKNQQHKSHLTVSYLRELNEFSQKLLDRMEHTGLNIKILTARPFSEKHCPAVDYDRYTNTLYLDISNDVTIKKLRSQVISTLVANYGFGLLNPKDRTDVLEALITASKHDTDVGVLFHQSRKRAQNIMSDRAVAMDVLPHIGEITGTRLNRFIVKVFALLKRALVRLGLDSGNFSKYEAKETMLDIYDRMSRGAIPKPRWSTQAYLNCQPTHNPKDLMMSMFAINRDEIKGENGAEWASAIDDWMSLNNMDCDGELERIRNWLEKNPSKALDSADIRSIFGEAINQEWLMYRSYGAPEKQVEENLYQELAAS